MSRLIITFKDYDKDKNIQTFEAKITAKDLLTLCSEFKNNLQECIERFDTVNMIR